MQIFGIARHHEETNYLIKSTGTYAELKCGKFSTSEIVKLRLVKKTVFTVTTLGKLFRPMCLYHQAA